ncbi:MAG: ribosome small subunit-dependent GTPase A [Planctomycetota bacterium]
MSERIEGTVLKRKGSTLQVAIPGGVLECGLSGKLRHDRQLAIAPAVVGDRVEVTQGEGGTGVIEKVLPRKSRLSRPDTQDPKRESVIVANADLLLIIQAVAAPEFDAHIVDRSLVMARIGGLEAAIVVNKWDLSNPPEIERTVEVYGALGYRTLKTSARTGEGLPALRDLLAGRTTVLFGPSGVGKSSLLNAVDPAIHLKVGELSEKTQEGKHTTTWAELMPLPGGGHVIDTPGIEVFGLWGIEVEDLVECFPEFVERIGTCRFNDCYHDAEPGCRIRDAVGSGIDPGRYQSYLKILRGLRKGRR